MFASMSLSFNRILIPVDFTVNTRVAIRKALALCEDQDASVHLLHVFRMSSSNIISIYQYFANYTFANHEFELRVVRKKMENLRKYILDIRHDISISTWISFGASIEGTIVEKAKRLQADIIIVGKNSHHCWMPFLNTVVPSRIAKNSSIPVLTVKPGAINNSIRTVVVPIGDRFPESKILIVGALRKKFHINVRLVTFLASQGDSKVIPASLLNTYRVLKNSFSSIVSYEVLYGKNRAKAILKYCNKVNADMLIVNPESETKIGWLNKQMSDVLPVHSKTQILTVYPVA